MPPPFPDRTANFDAEPSYGEISAAIGAELAQPLSALQTLAQELAASFALLPGQQRAFQAALETASKVARQSQQIARVAALQARQRFEQLEMEAVWAQALADYTELLQGNAIRIEQNIAPVDVMACPCMLTSLLEAALGWACDCVQEVNSIYNQQGVMQPDGRIKVLLENKNWPKRAVLTLKVTALDPHYSPRGQALETQRLSWYMTAQLARAMQVKIEKSCDGIDQIVVLEFTRALDHPEAQRPAAALNGPGRANGHTNGNGIANPPPSAHACNHLLLITKDDGVHFEVKKVIWELGWSYECVSTTLMAMSACYADLPAMVLIDERLRDPMFEQFRHEVLRRHPQLQFVELAINHVALEMDDMDVDAMQRLHCQHLRSGLVPLLN